MKQAASDRHKSKASGSVLFFLFKSSKALISWPLYHDNLSQNNFAQTVAKPLQVMVSVRKEASEMILPLFYME